MDTGSLPRPPWHERWRTGIRAAETTVVLAFWVGGVTAADMLIVLSLLAVGFAVGALAVAADPTRSLSKKGALILLLAAAMGISGYLVYLRHTATAIAPPEPLPTAEKIAEEVAKRSKEAHLAVTLVIDRESREDGTNFHFVMKNTGSAVIDVIRMDFSSGGGTDQERDVPFARTVSPGSAIIRPWVFPGVLSEVENISTNVVYDGKSGAGTRHFLLYCRFIVPRPYAMGSEIHPNDCKESMHEPASREGA